MLCEVWEAWKLGGLFEVDGLRVTEAEMLSGLNG